VQWGKAGKGKIELVEANFAGCTSDTLKFDVRIANATIDTIMGPRSVCPNITFVEYKTNDIQGMKYTWFVTGGSQSSGGNASTISINWGDVGTGTIKVVGMSKEGCITDTVYATVIKNHTIKGFVPIGDSVVCEFEQNKSYEVVYTRRSLYSWFVTGGSIVTPTNGPKINVNWGSAGMGKVSVVETSFDSINGLPCNGEPATLNVRISPTPSADKINGNMFICQTNDTVSYIFNGLPGSKYIWWLNNDSSGINGQGSSLVKFVWSLPGNFNLSVLEISKDSCIGNRIDTLIRVNPKPLTTAVIGDTTICYPAINNKLYSVTGFANSKFYWFITNGIINSGGNSNAVNVTFFDTHNASLKVVEVSEFGCVGDTQYIKVFVDHPGIIIKSVGDAYDNEKNILLQWRLLNAPRYNSKFEIWRRKAFTSDPFVKVDVVAATDSSYLQRNQNTDETAYEYQVRIKDLCGDTIISPFHRNVLLQGEKSNDDQYTVNLHWNRYFGWTDGVRTYELYRKNGDDGTYQLYDYHNDTSAMYKNGFDSYYQCYRIRAVENIGGMMQESWSNEICFGFDPIIWIPNAFSPDGNGLNDMYDIFTASIKEYHIQIYDRWGELLFENDNPKMSWDGTYKGKPCEIGAYIYIVEYKGFDNKRIIKNGTVTILR
jgi:gliding motility-associated-like protein